ncbi:hypothetical protein ACSBR1_031243 [Camellia fascicularis]
MVESPCFCHSQLNKTITHTKPIVVLQPSRPCPFARVSNLQEETISLPRRHSFATTCGILLLIWRL